jgi:hypothetical protein
VSAGLVSRSCSGADQFDSRLALDLTDIREMNEAGARVGFSCIYYICAKLNHSAFQYYVCGAGKIAVGVKSTLTEFIRSSRGCSMEEAGAAFDLICKGRFATDIFE